MSSKQLTVNLKLNTKQFELQLDKVTRKIERLNQITNQINNMERKTNKLADAFKRITKDLQYMPSAMRGVFNVASKFTNALKSSDSVLRSIWQRLRGIAATYIGLMGAKAVINTTDTLVGAQNKLNYVNAQSLGDSGYNSKGDYSQATLNLTNDALNKMYASSQKVRTSYQSMISNVSKTMALAGDAFEGNIDNAIRFQEIMAEAYAVGGASAKEMETSMYQLTQALGAGVLAGDELRSVREGAPLAFQAIEKFAQGVYNTDESLKDLAAQGKITSDMVVAAIMSAGNELDTAFAQTRQTFAQTWDQIKNSALYAFQPVMEMFTDTLQEAVENGLVKKFETFFSNVAKGVMIVVTTITNGINWIRDNWKVIKQVIVGALIAITSATIVYNAVSIYATYLQIRAWMILNGVTLTQIVAMLAVLSIIFIVIATVLSLIYVFYLWKSGAIDTCTAIVVALGIIATAILLIGIITGNVAMIIVAIVIAIVAVIIYYFDELSAVASGFFALLQAFADNLQMRWENMCNNIKSFFLNAIADMLESCDWLLKGINKIREALGKDPIEIGVLRNEADLAKSKIDKSYTDLSDVYWNAYDKKLSEDSNLKNKLNDWGSQFQNDKSDTSNKLLDRIGNKLGLDFSMLNTDFPTNGATGSNIEDLLGNIDDNTGSMADSMELTNEDLSYLRRIADMEWKKEYTTATINFKMDNNIQSEADYEGFITRFRNDLYEELSIVADGAYAY